jgi:hypothetical protein
MLGRRLERHAFGMRAIPKKNNILKAHLYGRLYGQDRARSCFYVHLSGKLDQIFSEGLIKRQKPLFLWTIGVFGA